MLEQIFLSVMFIVNAFIWHRAGVSTANRRHRRHNGATAQCAACSWESDRLPLSDAFNAAAAHTATPAATATERHRGFVVKA